LKVTKTLAINVDLDFQDSASFNRLEVFNKSFFAR